MRVHQVVTGVLKDVGNYNWLWISPFPFLTTSIWLWTAKVSLYLAESKQEGVGISSHVPVREFVFLECTYMLMFCLLVRFFLCLLILYLFLRYYNYVNEQTLTMGGYTHKAENDVADYLVNWIIIQHHCLCVTVSRNRFCLTLFLIMHNVNPLPELLWFVFVFVELLRTQRTSCHWRRKNVDHILNCYSSLIKMVSSNYAVLHQCFSSADMWPISGW